MWLEITPVAVDLSVLIGCEVAFLASVLVVQVVRIERRAGLFAEISFWDIPR